MTKISNLDLLFKKSFILSLLFTLILTVLVGVNAKADINVGDILVADDTAGSNSQGVIFVVNPITGQRTVLTDFSNPAQGPEGDDPRDLVMEPDGNVCVLDSEAGTNEDGAIFHVEAATGLREILSDLGNPAQGPLGDLPTSIALFSNGNLFFSDRDAPNGDGGIFQVDKVTGFRTLVTDLSNGAQGPLGEGARKIIEGPGGIIYLITNQGGINNDGILFSVNPDTGFRTVISDMGDALQGPTGNSRWIAITPGGTIYALINSTPEGIVSINPVTGNRQLVTDFTNGAQGPTESNVQGIVVDDNGQILVNGNNSDLLISVNPATGIRTVVSNYDDPGQGLLGGFGLGLIIATVATEMFVSQVPTLSEWGLIAMASILGIVGFMVARRRKATA